MELKDYENLLVSNLDESSRLMEATKSIAEDFANAVDTIKYVFKGGGKLLVAGNGGSDADARHFVGELVAGFYNHKRPALPVINLMAESSALTAWCNDEKEGYADYVRRALEAYGQGGDIFFPISTSGNAKNLLAAAKYARDNEILVIGLLGKGGGKLAELCYQSIVVPHTETPRIQEAQEVIYHTICQVVERELFPEYFKND